MPLPVRGPSKETFEMFQSVSTERVPVALTRPPVKVVARLIPIGHWIHHGGRVLGESPKGGGQGGGARCASAPAGHVRGAADPDRALARVCRYRDRDVPEREVPGVAKHEDGVAPGS